jgi:hypothetical protein
MAGSGSCRAPGTLLLDSRVNILPSEVAESPHKTPSPGLRTNLRHSITPGEGLAIALGIALAVPGGDETGNRNVTLVPRGESTRPQKLRRVSWGLRGSQKLLSCPQKPHSSPWKQDSSQGHVADIHEAYRTNGDMICAGPSLCTFP